MKITTTVRAVSRTVQRLVRRCHIHIWHGRINRYPIACGTQRCRCGTTRSWFVNLWGDVRYNVEKPNASVSISGDKPEYAPRTCSLWHPASEPPKQTEWVIASADDAVRCVAWNNDDRRWEDWDASGFDIDNIDWWMSIPLTPDKANAPHEPAREKGLHT